MKATYIAVVESMFGRLTVPGIFSESLLRISLFVLSSDLRSYRFLSTTPLEIMPRRFFITCGDFYFSIFDGLISLTVHLINVPTMSTPSNWECHTFRYNIQTGEWWRRRDVLDWSLSDGATFCTRLRMMN
ncbi:hypothetical protein R6Q59_024237 [Mikania micrantha]